jgi:hypothetical protein
MKQQLSSNYSLQDFRSCNSPLHCLLSEQVFFMIGCQRSGSNWLRTMLAEREDLIAPHPPHIMRDIAPILDKFGDLEEQTNLKVNCAHFNKLEMSCSLNLTIYYRQHHKTDPDRSRLCFRRIEPGSMDRYPRASDQIQASIDFTRSSSLIGMFSVQREVQCCE